MKIRTRDEERNAIHELIKMKLVKLNKSICSLKKIFFSENNMEKKKKLYVMMIEKIHRKISKIKFKKIHFSHIVDIYLADDNDDIYCKLKLNYSKYSKSNNPSDCVCKKNIIDNCINYINKETNKSIDVNSKLLDLIKDTNLSKDTKWINKLIDDKIFSSYKSGSTTTISTCGTVEYTIVTNSGNYTLMQNGSNYGIQFNAGFSGSLRIDNVPSGVILGVLAVGGGGSSTSYDDYKNISGGGGGGIFYNTQLGPNVKYPTLDIGIGISYNLVVGNSNQSTTYGANGLICYPGQKSTSTTQGGKVVSIKSYTIQPETPAYGNAWYYTVDKPSVYIGGNGGDLAYGKVYCNSQTSFEQYISLNGSNSGKINVSIPAITSSLYLGGGGASTCDGPCLRSISNGGNGYGGNTGSTSVSNPNGYKNKYGGSYGGGGSTGQPGGPGVFIIWWNVPN